MKLRLLVKLGEMILGTAFSEEEPRADMYLPLWMLALSMVFLAGGAALIVAAVVYLSAGAAIGAVAAIIFGVAALLCWKNQKLVIVSDEAFEYTTFLGNKKTYYFQDVVGLKRNNDSMTLLLRDGKVHIESCAIITDKFDEKFTGALEAINANN